MYVTVADGRFKIGREDKDKEVSVACGLSNLSSWLCFDAGRYS